MSKRGFPLATIPKWKKHLAVMWLAQVMGMGAITGVVSFLPLYVTHLGINNIEEAEIWAGVLMAISALLAGISGPYWGSMGDRKGRKPMVERVMLIFSLVMIGMAFVTNVYQLFFLRAVQGIFGGFTASAMALVISVTPEEETGYTLGIFQTAMVVGGAFGPLFGGLVADHLGYRAPFIIFGVLCLLSLATVHFFITEDFTPAQQQVDRSVGREIRSIISIPGIGSMLLVLFLIQFAIQVIAPVLPLYIQSLVGDSGYVATISGIIIATAGLTSSVSSASMGRLGKRFSHRVILITAAVFASLFFVLQALSSTVIGLGAFRALSGFCLGAMIPSANTIITFLIPPEKRGVAYGVTTGAGLMGNVIGPLSGGFFALYFGLPTVFWVTAILFMLTAFWVSQQVKEPSANN